MTTIGLLHPGDMGSAVGTAARAGGSRVLWMSSGRGPATQKRAQAAGLEDVVTLTRLVQASDVVISVCPPHAALDVARAVAAERFAGLYVDGNAVSPGTAREIGSVVQSAGAVFVDGGIVGPPPQKRGTTRLYLSGKDTQRIVALFDGTALEAIVVEGSAGAASALKMAYASYTKGSAAMLMAIRALATAEGVDEALLAEWSRSQPDLAARCESVAGRNAKKAWRFVGEMEEIAATFSDAGLPNGFYEAAAEVYRRMSGYKDTPPPSISDVAQALLAKRREG